MLEFSTNFLVKYIIKKKIISRQEKALYNPILIIGGFGYNKS